MNFDSICQKELKNFIPNINTIDISEVPGYKIRILGTTDSKLSAQANSYLDLKSKYENNSYTNEEKAIISFIALIMIDVLHKQKGMKLEETIFNVYFLININMRDTITDIQENFDNSENITENELLEIKCSDIIKNNSLETYNSLQSLVKDNKITQTLLLNTYCITIPKILNGKYKGNYNNTNLKTSEILKSMKNYLNSKHSDYISYTGELENILKNTPSLYITRAFKPSKRSEFLIKNSEQLFNTTNRITTEFGIDRNAITKDAAEKIYPLKTVSTSDDVDTIMANHIIQRQVVLKSSS